MTSSEDSRRLRAIGNLFFGERKVQAEMDRLRAADDDEYARAANEAHESLKGIGAMALAYVRLHPFGYNEGQRDYAERIGMTIIALAEQELARQKAASE